MVRALASHQCGPGSNPGVDAICGLSLLLVLSLAPRGFSPGTPVFPSPQKPLTLPNSNSIWNARTRLNEFIRTSMCLVGKQAIYNFFFVKSEIIEVSVMRISFGLRLGLIILDITKTSSNNVLVIVINTLFELQMDKYPLLRDQVEKIVVQHGRKGETKSKDQVLEGVICSGVFFILFA